MQCIHLPCPDQHTGFGFSGMVVGKVFLCTLLVHVTLSDCLSDKKFHAMAYTSFGPGDDMWSYFARSKTECAVLCDRTNDCENIKWKKVSRECRLLGHIHALSSLPDPDTSWKLFTRYKYHKLG